MCYRQNVWWTIFFYVLEIKEFIYIFIYLLVKNDDFQLNYVHFYNVTVNNMHFITF